MESMPEHPRLYKRNGTFYHRGAVPVDIQNTYGKTEETFSLKTKDPREAVKLVRIAAAKVDAKFEQHRQRLGYSYNETITNELLYRIAKEYYAFLLEEDDVARQRGYSEASHVSYKIPATKEGYKLLTEKLIPEHLNKKTSIHKKVSDLEYIISHAKKEYALGQTELSFDQADWLESVYGITITEDDSELRAKAGKILAEAELKAFSDCLKRIQGEAIETPVYSTVKTKESLTLLSEAIKPWIDEKVRTGQWVDKTVNDHRRAISHFISLVGNKPYGTYTKADARLYKRALTVLPANWTKQPELTGLTMAEAVEYAEANGLQPMSHSNANKMMEFVGSFFRWAQYNYDDDVKDIFKGLNIKIKSKRREERSPFSMAELSQLFTSPLYTGCLSESRLNTAGNVIPDETAMYWLPLISLYTGARMGEIAQLYVSDIKQDDAIYYLNINDKGDDKRLKNSSSERAIPIHPHLISLGLIEFVASKKAKGEKRLFSDIAMGNDGYYSSTFSKKFNRYIGKIGIKHDKNAFHSFRHNFEDACRAADISPSIMNALQGHTEQGMASRYGEGYTLGKLYNAISTIDYLHLPMLSNRFNG